MNFKTFQIDQAIRVALSGTFQRGHIYPEKNNFNEDLKKDFHKYLSCQLMLFFEDISNGKYKNETVYCEAIISFANKVSAHNENILNSGRFRIGSTQKLMNLFWKFCWIYIPEFPKPLHCPFDGIVLASIMKLDNEENRWTKVDDIETYNNWVLRAKYLADKETKSIAVWEADEYYKRTKLI